MANSLPDLGAFVDQISRGPHPVQPAPAPQGQFRPASQYPFPNAGFGQAQAPALAPAQAPADPNAPSLMGKVLLGLVTVAAVGGLGYLAMKQDKPVQEKKSKQPDEAEELADEDDESEDEGEGDEADVDEDEDLEED
jgi:hypothetical protein